MADNDGTKPKDHLCYSVGLSGDGDEVAAITDVEDAFGVRLDYDDALKWYTAGDVFASLESALAPAELQAPDLWPRFAAALAGQTGIDPSLIEPSSPLMMPGSRFWARIADASAILWLLGASVLIGSIAVATL